MMKTLRSDPAPQANLHFDKIYSNTNYCLFPLLPDFLTDWLIKVTKWADSTHLASQVKTISFVVPKHYWPSRPDFSIANLHNSAVYVFSSGCRPSSSLHIRLLSEENLGFPVLLLCDFWMRVKKWLPPETQTCRECRNQGILHQCPEGSCCGPALPAKNQTESQKHATTFTRSQHIKPLMKSFSVTAMQSTMTDIQSFAGFWWVSAPKNVTF